MRLHRVNARLFECALSNTSGIQRLTFYPNNTVMSGLYANAAEDLGVGRTAVVNSGVMPEDVDAVLEGMFEPTVLTCRVRTLSEILDEQDVERIDLLKIDAEKSELDVWQDPGLEGTNIRLIFARRASAGAGLRRRSGPRPPGLARARLAR